MLLSELYKRLVHKRGDQMYFSSSVIVIISIIGVLLVGRLVEDDVVL